MKKALYTLFLIFVTCTFSSCEMFGDGCKTCRQVTYDNGHAVNWGPEAVYCDDDLLAILRTPSHTSGGVTITWECR